MKTNCKGQSTIDRETMRSCSELPPAVTTKTINGLGSKITRSLCHSILLPALSGVHRNSISGLKSNQSSASQTSAKNTQRTNAEGKTKSSRGLLKLMEITEMWYKPPEGRETLAELVTQALGMRISRRARLVPYATTPNQKQQVVCLTLKLYGLISWSEP